MRKHRLRWSGHPPMVFDGDMLTFQSSRKLDGYEQIRWFEVSVYSRFSGGVRDGYVVKVAYLSSRQHADHPPEPWREEVCIVASREAVAAVLAGVNPLPWFVNWPRIKDEKRRQALEAELLAAYERLSIQAIAALPDDQ